jgi:hypothetical protein
MADSSPLTPAAAKKELARFKTAVNAAMAKNTAAFKMAARKAARDDADEIANQHAALSKKLGAMTVKILAATLQGRVSQVAQAGTRVQTERIAAEMQAIKTAMLQAMLKKASMRVRFALVKFTPPAAKHWPIDNHPLFDDPGRSGSDGKQDRRDIGKARPWDHGVNSGDERSDGCDD